MKKVFLALTFLSLSLVASEAVTKKEVKILDGGKDVGVVTVLTPVDKLSVKDGIAIVKIKGFRNANYPQQVVRSMKLGEVYAEIEDEKEALKLFKATKKFEDDYGEEWEEVEGELKIKADALTTDKTKLYAQAKQEYAKSCSMCHNLRETHDYTVNQWPRQIDTMKQYVKLEPKVKKLIIKYLQQNAKDVK